MDWHKEQLYSQLMLYRRMTRGEHQHLARSSEDVTENSLCFLGHITSRPSDHIVQVVVSMVSDIKWKRRSGTEGKSRRDVVKEKLSTLGVDRQLVET
ncbi:hypothetical protein RB195_007588 [Necator americanus]